MKISLEHWLFFISFVCKSAESAKILAVFAFPGPSQYILVQPYLKTLAAKGHELTVVNAFPQKQHIKNYRDVPVMEMHDNYAELIKIVNHERGKWEELSFHADFFLNVTETVFKNVGVQRVLKAEKFDLVIVETLHTDAWYALGKHFNAPVIGVSSFGTDIIMDELMGNISPLSYNPLKSAGMTERMTYWERLYNAFFSLLEIVHLRIYTIPRHRKILNTYLPHIKEDIWDLRSNFSLMLLNQHFSLSYPRPYVPNMVEVGGFQIQYSAQPLPKDILNFIDSSEEDVIYFSMGSNIKSKDFPAEKLQMITEIFANLPYKILWKFEDETLPKKPKNVFIKSWFPQSDVLAHPRVKLFISHGGLLSTTEAIYHGKPMLGLPVFYDQQMNIRKGVQAGFAEEIDFLSLPGQEFKSKILKLISNPKYINNAKKISVIYHDQPMKPLDVAVYWTEYVLRHHGAVHLQNPAQKMSFIQKHSIDTVGVLLLFSALCVVFTILALWNILRCIFSRGFYEKQKLN